MVLEHHKMLDCAFPEVQKYLETSQTVIIPYGLSEQHGAHLPLDVDIRTAEFVALDLAKKLNCLVAPTVTYSFSGGMLPGTINIKPTTFCNLMCDIIESLHLQGFRNFVIIPGHGGSESLMQLKEALRIQKWLNPALADAMILLTPIWEFSPTWYGMFDERDYHAGKAETALLLHYSPEVVRMDKLVMDVPEIAENLRQDPDSYQLRQSFTELNYEIVQTSQREEVKLGVMGYPEQATAELGRKMAEECVENGSKLLQKAIAAADEARRN